MDLVIDKAWRRPLRVEGGLHDLEIADLVEKDVGSLGEPSQFVAAIAAVTAEDDLEIGCLEPVADRRHRTMVDPDRAHGHPLVAHDA